MRYPTDINPWPYEYDGEYFDNYFMIIGRVDPAASELSIQNDNYEKIALLDLADTMVMGYYAFVLLTKNAEHSIHLDGVNVRDIASAAETSGVVRIDIEQVEE